VNLGVEVAIHSKPTNIDVMRQATMNKYARRAIFWEPSLFAPQLERGLPDFVPILVCEAGVAVNYCNLCARLIEENSACNEGMSLLAEQ
jgi:hypothetical protein